VARAGDDVGRDGDSPEREAVVVEWDADAEGALSRVPTFVRPFVRRKVEGFGRTRGASRITLKLLREARAEIGPGPEAGGSAAPAPGQIEQLEARLVSEQAERRRTRTYHVRVCAGAVGCPRSLLPVESIADAVVREIDAAGFPQHLAGGRQGLPILSHHRFQAAVAGCPNACSQPHICDFGVIGFAPPAISACRCNACGSCVTACREDAIVLREGQPLLDLERCLGCGDCVYACQTETLQFSPAACRIVAGGKLGRLPRLAADVLAKADSQAITDVLAAALDLLIREGTPGERLGALIDRDQTIVPRLRQSPSRSSHGKPRRELDS
jgi:ferredoxin